MFFRTKKTKTGQALQLVASYRDSEGNPRQRIILSLGDVNISKELQKIIAYEVENHFKDIQSLFPLEKETQIWVDRIVKEIEKKGWSSPTKQPTKEAISIHPEEISHHSTTELGPELVALKAWEALGFPSLLTGLGFNTRQVIDAGLSIMNRLIDPCAEHALPAWVQTTSFEDIFKKPLRHLSEDRFYRIADKLLTNKEKIEQVLSKNEQTLFGLKRTILLYDLTNTYFEGNCLNNPKAKRGHSKEKRMDAPLLSVGLILDSEGFVIKHEVFEGNTSDSSSLLPMIEKLQGEDLGSKPCVIIDGGIASEDNLKTLRAHGYDYIAVGKRPTRVSYEEAFDKLTFREISEREGKPVVKVASLDKDNERIVLCYSESRGEKEKQIISKAEEKYLKDIEKLKQRILKGKIKKVASAERALGRLIERHSRVTRYYETAITEVEEKITLTANRLEEKYEKACKLSGKYYLRCSRKDLNDSEIWKIYIMLTKVESSFRALKTNLGLRPVYHQREDRCDSHIFITILAYRLLHWIEYTLREKGEIKSWSTIRRLLQTHAYTTIVCPCVDRSIYHIRAAGTPDSTQKDIYEKLCVDTSHLSRTQTLA